MRADGDSRARFQMDWGSKMGPARQALRDKKIEEWLAEISPGAGRRVRHEISDVDHNLQR